MFDLGALDANAPLAAPLVCSFFVGFALTGGFQCMGVMLVDLYPLSPATATAANNFVRCLMGAAGTALIIPMIEGVGRGWAFTIVTGLVVAFSPILWVLQRWGPEWREGRRVKLENRKERKTRREAEVELEKAGHAPQQDDHEKDERDWAHAHALARHHSTT